MHPSLRLGLLVSLPFLALYAHAATDQLVGSNVPSTQTFALGAIRGLEAGGTFDVTVIEAEMTPNVTISWDQNLMPHVSAKVHNGTLRLAQTYRGGISSKLPLRVVVYTHSLQTVDLSGAARLTARSLHATTPVTVEASGVAHVTLGGSATRLSVDASGSASVMAREFETPTVALEASGTAKVVARATQAARAEASGASHIVVHATAATAVTEDKSGVADIEILR